MSRVIAGVYEIQNKIGAGGGGIVYLGRHQRLEKTVVLKADKRTLDTDTEILRREVDMLKGLSHTYIPQVYDFVQEDGVVYTVMDYIEGESLDKLLARKQIPTQQQVIRWACQLLEALSYLHGQQPHGILHGDIKPANIMLRPSGDICLIDFNIALALGENGAVKVGFSSGYASPEHYGVSYFSGNRAITVRQILSGETQEQTLLLPKEDSEQTLKLETDGSGMSGVSSSDSGSSKGRQKEVTVDVCSDIYSLGATLYHLLSGKRPALDALEVKSLGTDVCNPEVAAIIQKAMAPDPAMRYQSAEEMLTAFLQLYKNDRRTIHHRRHMVVASVILSGLFLSGGICSFVGLKQMEQRQTALALAEYSANSLADGDVTGAIDLALQAIPTGNSILEAPVTAQAQKALTDALGVYDLADGFKALDRVELPSAPFDIAVSPKGTYFAAVYAYETAIFRMENQQKIVTLQIENSALSDVVFLDETRLIYAGEEGVTVYDLDMQSVVWTGEKATTLAVSADAKRVAAVNRDDDKVIIYQVSDGKKIAERSLEGKHLSVAVNDAFADPMNNIFALNRDGSMLAVSFHDGGLTIFDLNEPENDMVIYEESDYRHFEGGFCRQYFAFSTGKGGESLFGLIDTEKAAYLGGYDSKDAILLRAEEQGIYIANSNLLVELEPDTLEEKELAYTDNLNITNFSVAKEYVLAATENQSFSFYDSGAHLMSTESGSENWDFVRLTDEYAVLGNRSEPWLRIMKLENHSEARLVSYDARFAHDEARVSQDGQTVMLFSYKNFRIYDKEGELLTQVEMPDADSIYDQQFRRNEKGSWLEVIWYDGTVRCYSAADGSMISEEVGKKPSKDLYEEFYTEKYRIASGLHTAPEVYDLASGKQVGTLEEKSYLTYVTQVGEYIMTEYISAEGERYGILLDDSLQKLAYLPNLCDATENQLVFDYGSGNLRQCRLYSLPELITLGKTYTEEN